MANQGRPRLCGKGDVACVEDGKSSSLSQFTYSPLDTSVDGIRLVILEPSIGIDNKVHCRLEHVTFGQMPKYEALSYTWGSEAFQFDILIDDKTFPVRSNLHDALIQLRRKARERALWIDAICINQDDIPERNQQVRIMPHIYSRAQVVLVWLGTPIRSTLTPAQEMAQRLYNYNREDLQFLNMSDAPYWHRVWIVQEIGKARKIIVHYDRVVVDWDSFIKWMSRNRKAFPQGLPPPLRLAQKMLDKYGDGYKLENLLRTHRNALCKDVRDKVYGFTGLANDTYGRLPMDYGKTPFEVWKDVVAFRNADKSTSQHDILHFAQFARQLLGGVKILGREDITIDEALIESAINVRDSYSGSFRNERISCPARLWGRIACVGPTYHEIRANLFKVDEWKASIKEHVSEPCLRSAHEENDLLLQLLEDLDHSDLEIVLHPTPIISYVLSSSDQGDAVEIMSGVVPKSSILAVNDRNPRFRHETTCQDKCLILLDLFPDNGQGKPAASKPYGGIGIASHNVTAGDFICCIYKEERAVVVRRHIDHDTRDRFSTVASAVFPDFRAMSKEKNSCGKTDVKFSVLTHTLPERNETINICMDIGLVYEWIDLE